ncbi:MAG: DUF1573 domain-containing protein [Phycisphaerales bacterium]|nr:DUF1573 domain-containing protein [Phycisphaerales bacterium]
MSNTTSPIPEKRGGPLAGALVVLGLVVLAILAWFVIQLIMASPLSGGRHHDFGTIMLKDIPTHTKAHVFQLENTSGQPLTIRKVTASCGCTEITPYEKSIPVDGIAEIPVRMSLKRSTREKADITITFVDAPPMKLSVEAAGRLANPLIIEPRGLRLRPGDVRPVTIVMENWDDQPREMPTIELPEGIDVKTQPWKRVRESNASRGMPSLDRTTLEVKVPEDAQSMETIIKIVLEDQFVVIPVLVKVKGDYKLPEADQGRNENHTFNPLHRGELQENDED